VDDSSIVAKSPHGHCATTFQLPIPVNGTVVAASFEKGVPEITLPKADESKVKRIAISLAKRPKRAVGGSHLWLFHPAGLHHWTQEN